MEFQPIITSRESMSRYSNINSDSDSSSSRSSMLIELNMYQKHVLVIAGEHCLDGRLSKLLRTGCFITVVGKLKSAHSQSGQLHYVDRQFESFDLTDQSKLSFGPVDLVVCCSENIAIARYVYDISKSVGLTVSCSGLPEFSDLNFTADFVAGPLQIGISTGGHASVLAGRLRNSLVENTILDDAVAAIENVIILRRRLRSTDPQATTTSPRMKLFDKFCASASFKTLSSITEEEMLVILKTMEGNAQETPIISKIVQLTSGVSATCNQYLNPFCAARSILSYTQKFNPFVKETKDPNPDSLNQSTTNVDNLSNDIQVDSPSSAFTETSAESRTDSAINLASPISSTRIFIGDMFHYASDQTFQSFKGITSLKEAAAGIQEQSLSAFQYTKRTSEIYIARGLDSLNPSLSGTIRTLLTQCRFPLEISKPRGKLFVIGAGPGDPGLMTLRAIKLLKTAHVVVHECMIPRILMDFIKPTLSASTLFVQKGPSTQCSYKKGNITEWLDKGMTVVYLKSGDSQLYGGTEAEIVQLQKSDNHHISFVPGISPIFATGFPLTLKDVSNSVVIVSGGNTKSMESIPQFKSTTSVVVIAPVASFSLVIKRLRDNGYPASLPIAICEKVGWSVNSGERILSSTLEKVVATAHFNGVTSPAVLVIGNVVLPSKESL